MGVASRPVFISLEGIEASGKSTLLEGLAERIRAQGAAVVSTREPGGTPLGERLRDVLLHDTQPLDPLTELFLFCGERAQHVRNVIAPALAAGSVVLCDRFTDATRAYQGGGRGLDDAMIVRYCNDATGGIAPALTLLVDVPVSESAQRLDGRGRESRTAPDRMEREDAEFHDRVRARYLLLAEEHRGRIKVLDGTKPPDAVLDDAWREVATLLSAR